jgi:hypothetical protein
MQENVLSALYTNDVTAEYLRDLDRPPFSEEALTTFSPAALAQVSQRKDVAWPDDFLPAAEC